MAEQLLSAMMVALMARDASRDVLMSLSHDICTCVMQL